MNALARRSARLAVVCWLASTWFASALVSQRPAAAFRGGALSAPRGRHSPDDALLRRSATFDAYDVDVVDDDLDDEDYGAASSGGPSPYAGAGPIEKTPLLREHAGLPVIVVIGRPNVGKSALSNRIAGSNTDGTIVHDEPGVTRDRTYQPGSWCGDDFYVVDTGGLVFDDTDDLFVDDIREQAMMAISEASILMVVADGQAGLTAMDERVAKMVRRLDLPTFLAVNKCESHVHGAQYATEFWNLGLGEPFPVSGLHGTGVAELLDAMRGELELDEAAKEEAEASAAAESARAAATTNVAIIGRPNVGKSSLLNRLFGQYRAIVSDIAGTTRDPIDAILERDDKIYRFVDTAGIRRRNKVSYGSEFFMVNRALKAVRRANVALLVLDMQQGILEQDLILADRIGADGRACIIIANKWDLVQKDQKTYLEAERFIRDSLNPVRWAEIVLVSALTGKRCDNIYDAVDRAREAHGRRVPTAILNEVLRDALLFQPPPTKSGTGRGKIYYAIQVATEPPTILAFCNNPKLFSENYRRYLERKIRESLDFVGTPIRLLFRGKRARRV